VPVSAQKAFFFPNPVPTRAWEPSGKRSGANRKWSELSGVKKRWSGAGGYGAVSGLNRQLKFR